jgi:hypothetical protein
MRVALSTSSRLRGLRLLGLLPESLESLESDLGTVFFRIGYVMAIVPGSM